MDAAVTALRTLPRGRWWLHELELARQLGFKAREGLSVRSQVSGLIGFIEEKVVVNWMMEFS
jgi:hypothetical protein